MQSHRGVIVVNEIKDALKPCIMKMERLAVIGDRNSKEKTIYITSDDGPLDGTTNIIDIANELHIPITLFLVGKHVISERFDTIERGRSSKYIQIANHSYSHANGHYYQFYKDIPNVIEDMKKNNSILKLGNEVVDARLPGRNIFRLPDDMSRDEFGIKKPKGDEPDMIYRAGFKLYGWDLEWRNHKYVPIQSVDTMLLDIKVLFKKNQTFKRNKLIILMHDPMFGHEGNGKILLLSLLRRLKSDGYQFDFIRNY